MVTDKMTTDYADGQWVAITMGQFCQIVIDSGPRDAVLFRVVDDVSLPGSNSFIRHMDVLLVPDGAITASIAGTGARVHKILKGLMEIQELR